MKTKLKYLAVVAISTLTLGCTETPQSAEAGTPDHKRLRIQAIAQAKDYNTGLSGICDSLVNITLKNITYGTANSGFGGTTRFPAIIANYEGVCVKMLTGDRGGGGG